MFYVQTYQNKILPFLTHGHRDEKCFQIIHSDVSPVLSHANYKYFDVY